MRRILAVITLLLAAACPCGAAALEIGAVPPDVSGPGLLDQKPVRLSALRGRVVLLDFWASWCAPCKVSLPELNALHRELLASGFDGRFEIIAVNVDTETPAALHFLARQLLDYPVISDTQGTWAQAFQLPTMPASYLIGPDGRIAGIYPGYRSGDADQLIKPAVLRLLEHHHE